MAKDSRIQRFKDSKDSGPLTREKDSKKVYSCIRGLKNSKIQKIQKFKDLVVRYQ